MSFRGKQFLVVTAVAAAVALATSLLNVLALADAELARTRDSADLGVRTLYHQARDIMSRVTPAGVPQVLAVDPGLRRHAEAIVGYAPTVLYLAIVDEAGVALFHSDLRLQGATIPAGVSLDELLARSAPSRLVTLIFGDEVLVTDLPFSVDGTTRFGSVRAAQSSLFLRDRLVREMASSTGIATTVVVIALLGAYFVADRLFAPIDMLRRELARLDTGHAPPLDLQTEHDVERIAEFFAGFGRKLESGEGVATGDGTLPGLVDDLAEGAMVVDGADRILALNEPAARLLGADCAAIAGRVLSALETPGAFRSLAAIAADARAATVPVGPRAVSWDVDGRPTAHAVAGCAVHGAGSAGAVLLTVRNLDRISTLGSRLSFSRKLASLGGLASSVAHEIRNPLNGIALRLGLLRDEREHGDSARHLDAMEREVRRLDHILGAFLQFARPEPVQLAPVEVSELFRVVLDDASGRIAEGSVDVAVDVSERLPPVWGSADLLRQALLNLVLNACDAMPAGGRLRLRGESAHDGRVALVVEDEGIGIEPDKLPRIFQLFYTDKDGGSGIGLAVIQRIVELHGGEIDVASEPGRGTRFTIRLAEART